MALREAVTPEVRDQVKDLAGGRLSHTALLGTLEKLGPALIDDLLLLLADRLDASIGTRQLDPAQPVQDPHHLLLKNHYAVGFSQDLLHDLMRISRSFAPVLAVHVGFNHAAAERAGPIESAAGDQIADVIWPHSLEQFADAVRFKLEHALGIAALEQGIGLGIIEREFLEVDPFAARLLDQLHGVVQQGQSAQPQEIHFEETDLLQVAHAPLRRDD